MKQILWNKSELSHALQRALDHKFFTNITGVSIDSRSIIEGDMFFALSGNNYNGNNFIDEALQKGASICFSDDITKVKLFNIKRVIDVKNVLKTLNFLARYRRNALKATLIAITGSLGKTSTKEMFKLALSSNGKTFANDKNLNNHYGMPLSLVKCPKNIEFCILELGMSAKGEIANLVDIAKPDVVIITNIYPVHLAFFRSIKEISYAKSEIFKNVNDQGFAILNNESNYFEVQMKEAQQYSVQTFTFSTNNDANCYIKKIEINDDKYKSVKIQCFDVEFNQKFHFIVGEYLIANSLPLFICVHVLKLNLTLVQKSLETFKPKLGRGEVINLKKIKLIDDSYNSSPDAVRLAIKNAKSFKFENSRLLAILGDMKELGDCEVDFHKNVQLDGIDKIFCVGKLMKNLFNQTNNNIRGVYTNDSIEMAKIITDYIIENDIILIKGSCSMNMKLIVDQIKSKFSS